MLTIYSGEFGRWASATPFLAYKWLSWVEFEPTDRGPANGRNRRNLPIGAHVREGPKTTQMRSPGRRREWPQCV